jgi:hypothetical protein
MDGEQVSVIPVERAEEEARLMRQGAGNYANLCGVLSGFVAVIIVLILSPGFYPELNMLSDFVLVVFFVSSLGYVTTAWHFISISHKGLWDYKSYEDMVRDFDQGAAAVGLSTMIFLGGVAVLSYSKGGILMTGAALAGFIFVAASIIRSLWVLARRSRPEKRAQRL